MSDVQEATQVVGAGNNLLTYKGYLGQVEFDSQAGLFHGEVINTRDVITFQGECVVELQLAFSDSVEDYLEFCAERGETPEKPFSGKFVVRVNPDLHRKAALLARQKGISLNKVVTDALEEALG
jgi:predicted HicB family RNase H-like nuclease